jgi:hypothetical protein
MSENWEQFIHVRSPKFAALPGEEDELVNPGMFGKALSLYLQEKLAEKGHEVPTFNCEDWGWWVEVAGPPFPFGVCVYCGAAQDGTHEYACLVGLTSPSKWSWKQFRKIDATPWARKLFEDLVAVFESDPQVELVAITEDCPVGYET